MHIAQPDIQAGVQVQAYRIYNTHVPCICAHAHFHTFMDLCGHVRYSHQRQARKEALTRYKIIRPTHTNIHTRSHKYHTHLAYIIRRQTNKAAGQDQLLHKLPLRRDRRMSWTPKFLLKKGTESETNMTSVESRSAFSVSTSTILFVIHSSNLEYSIWQFLTIYTPEV